MKRFKLLLAGIFISLISFSQNIEVSHVEVMKIVKQKPIKLYFDEYSTDIEFIPLKSIEKSAIGIVVNIEVDDEHIYVLDHTKTLTIYNLDGSYVNKLKSSGNGPGEFAHLGIHHLIEDIGNLVVYDDAQRKLLFYNTDGEFEKEHKFNFSIDAISHLDKNTLILLSDGIYNVTDTPGHIISFIDIEKMEVIEKLHLLTRQHPKSAVSYVKPRFIRNKNEVILQLPFCDTLFQITKGSYVPKFIFQTKGTSLKPEMLKDQRSRRDIARYTTQFSTPYETDRFLQFRVDYKAKAKIISKDKKTGKWSLLDAPEYKKPGFRIRGVDAVTFTPKFCNSEYYYSFIEAIDFKTNFSNLYPALSRNVNAEDNPLIVRAKIE